MSKPAFSFEFFPAKTEQGHEKLLSTYDELNKLSPAYFSVTYGAGGSTRSRTLDIVQALSARGTTEIAPHMSCIGDDKSEIAELLEYYKTLGIREHSGDHFHIEVASYPEMHPQARSFEFDIDNLVNKYQAGANASITQFFYNADSYLYLRDKLEKRGIDTVAQPLVAGIMPITNSSNLLRFADSCGADIPRYVRKQLTDFGDDRKAIREFGFDVVYRLCERLIAEGVPAMHFYSMNKVEPNKRLVEAL